MAFGAGDARPAEVAQSVEQWTENPCVASSILALGTSLSSHFGTAQRIDCVPGTVLNIKVPSGASGSGSVVEHLLAKEGVASSNLVFRSIFYGDVAKWLRQGSAKPLSSVRFRPSPPNRYRRPGI